MGWSALGGNSSGSGNTAIGWTALTSNFDGNDNTAIGLFALHGNTSGSNNTANGASALFSNTNGINNTASGFGALTSNTTGSSNTANGYQALANSSGSSNNTGIGFQALFGNGSGHDNTAGGFQALFSNTNGHDNTAIGHNALQSNTTGDFNVALGANAGFNLTTGNNNIDIFNRGVAGESNTIRIGKAETHTATFIAGISGATVPGGVGVIVDSSGHLGTTTSSARFKEAIKPMDKASEAILALQPVTFHYKKELDPKAIAQFGLIAEDVEKINPDLVARDEEGKPYSVRYEAVNAMLLNEFLKEHKAFVEEQRIVQEQGTTIARQQKQIETLTVGLQQVSAQLALSKAERQTVQNSQ